MHSGITLVDVRKEAMDTIKQLRDKEIDVKTASEIRNLLGVIVDTTKVQIEFIRALPKTITEGMGIDGIKQIVGSLKNADAEVDTVLEEINKNKANFIFDPKRKVNE